jgi:hypothetical protein
MADEDLPTIKNEKQYHALRERGLSKEMAARIANAPAMQGGAASAYDDQTYEELYEKAKELNIRGRSKMNKDELIEAIRSA